MSSLPAAVGGSAGWCGRVLPLLAALLWLVPAPPVRAHELDFQSLQIIYDPADGVLRGQVVSDPRQVAGQGAARADELLALLRENLALELDGASCPLRLEVRELWVRAGATLGDVVMAYCTPQAPPHSLRVFLGSPLHGLNFTVQRVDPNGEVFTDQTLVLGGSWSPTYDFESGWLAQGAPPTAASPAADQRSQARAPLAQQYLRYGIDHILDDGWDHVAFVATLVLGATQLGFAALIMRLSAFTVAHSITLACGALGWVMLPRSVVEPCIALSIAVLALWQLWRRDRSPRARYDLAVPFAFGLLHGQGFASVLVDSGLPVAGLVVALLAFNVGVELGQALWAGVFWVALRALRWLPERSAARVLWLCSLGLAALGLYWTWQRTASALLS